MAAKIAGRIMILLGLLIFVCLFSYQVFAKELSVFNVARNIQLDPKEPVYHDYYIDGGADDGLKMGALLTVYRRLPVHDTTRNKSLGDFRLPVAKIKIIHAENKISIARLVATFGGPTQPVIDFKSIMVGDIVEVTGMAKSEADDDSGESSSGKSVKLEVTHSKDLASITVQPTVKPVEAPAPKAEPKPEPKVQQKKPEAPAPTSTEQTLKPL